VIDFPPSKNHDAIVSVLSPHEEPVNEVLEQQTPRFLAVHRHTGEKLVEGTASHNFKFQQ
jgi:hypothetical protein